MANALYHLPSIYCTSQKQLCSSSSFAAADPLLNRWASLHHHHQHSVPSSCCLIVTACSGKKSRASKKLKATKSIKSNTDLCNELRDFISMVGLPENCVPSMKVLSEHGRKDLANIVRRRGYKLIADLLTNTTELDTNPERNFSVNCDGNDVSGSDSAGPGKGRNNELEVDISLSSKASAVEDHLSHTNNVVPTIFGVETPKSTGSLSNSSLYVKASKFVQSGELETVEGALGSEDMQMLDGLDLVDGSSNTSGSEVGKGYDDIGVEHKSSGHEILTCKVIGGNVPPNLNGGVVASTQAALLAEEHKPHRDDILPSEEMNIQDFNFQANKMENQIEIDRLKKMLQQKELELAHLKQQIEEEKFALSALQSKANIELGNAQKIISEKDAELYAAEESLSGLKEVQIEYLGNGEIVEVAGSFNGWHHRIQMDRLHSSNRKSILWSTVLWLYPGIYEIKFIVDGHWTVDPQRELVMSGGIQNNILRVDR